MISIKSIFIYLLSLKRIIAKSMKEFFYTTKFYNKLLDNKIPSRFFFYPNPYLLSPLLNHKDLLIKNGFNIVSGGTDCHMVLVDLTNKRVTGKLAEESLDRAGITCNKNAIPFDKQSPFITSGIRVGTAAGTTRGFKENQFEFIADCISKVIEVLSSYDDKLINKVETSVLFEIEKLCQDFPIYK